MLGERKTNIKKTKAAYCYKEVIILAVWTAYMILLKQKQKKKKKTTTYLIDISQDIALIKNYGNIGCIKKK